MSEAPRTNPYLSSVHAACFSKKISAASTGKELEAAAAAHSAWLLGKDRDRLREQYRARLEQVGHRK